MGVSGQLAPWTVLSGLIAEQCVSYASLLGQALTQLLEPALVGPTDHVLLTT